MVHGMPPASKGSGAEATTHFGFRTVDRAEKAGLVADVFNDVAERYDLMNDLMSGGLHRHWKTALIDWLKPRPPMHLVDLAGGTGDVAYRVLERAGRRGGDVQATVVDINARMLAMGRARADRRPAARSKDGRLHWLCADAERLPIAEAAVDAVTIAFGIRNCTDIAAVLAEARRVLRPGGRFLCLEFSRFAMPGVAPLYDAYSFRVIPRLGALVARNREAYQYLVESIRRFPDQDRFAEMIGAACLEQVRYRNLAGGIAALHSAWRI